MGNTSSASEPIVTGVADMVRCSGANGSGSSEVRSFFSLIFLTVVTPIIYSRCFCILSFFGWMFVDAEGVFFGKTLM